MFASLEAQNIEFVCLSELKEKSPRPNNTEINRPNEGSPSVRLSSILEYSCLFARLVTYKLSDKLTSLFSLSHCLLSRLKSCADTKVGNKTLFPTFARTSLGPPEKISKSVIALLKAYQWRKFIIVSDTRQWTKEITLAIKV